MQLGSFAVFIRQTNIIWVLFVASSGVINYSPVRKNNPQLHVSDLSIRKDKQLASNVGITGGSKLRKRRPRKAVDNISHSTQRSSTSATCSSGFIEEIQDTFLTAWLLKWELLVSFSPFFLVLVAFVAFVCWNGSIVLGAKEAHAVSPHFAQLMYFSLVSTLFVAPFQFTLPYAPVVVQSFRKSRLPSCFQWFIGLTVGFLSVHFFSVAHPYLLADNRHYTFYIWRKVINAHWSTKYLLVPFYVYSWFSIFSILAKAQKKVWVLAYFLACAAVLIPTPLIEFRYYTIPFFFLVLNSQTDDYKSWLLMGILYIAVNIFTMFMFLSRPFSWNHESGIQRFIW
ncbi:hypothetical protein RHMOL_Rhmol05G0268600 [Rhododendron molle]|uniref:Uncharacterized protein n=1 Tax=Rhododendron molle TaxID=49168 RepID=A0ACC0NUS5_RHOML|nr:hypothetical protein RHMOL_Rhmol05G0268600 [Rhododendron molle]